MRKAPREDTDLGLARIITLIAALSFGVVYVGGAVALERLGAQVNAESWSAFWTRLLFTPELDALQLNLRAARDALLDALSLLLGPGAAAAARLSAGAPFDTGAGLAMGWAVLALAALLALPKPAPRATPGGGSAPGPGEPRPPVATGEATAILAGVAVLSGYALWSVGFLLAAAFTGDNPLAQALNHLSTAQSYAYLAPEIMTAERARLAQDWLRWPASLSSAQLAAPGVGIWSVALFGALLRARRLLRLRRRYPYLRLAPPEAYSKG
ncbi:MAG: hypothetical protein AAF909_00340 [Pseudomonadota bacterium]